MGRRPKESPFTLFAFQDIITSVTGVMILIALLLSLLIGATVPDPPESDDASEAVSPESLDQLRDEVERMQAVADDGLKLQQVIVGGNPEGLREKVKTMQQALDQLTRRRTERRNELDELSQNTAHVAAQESAIETLQQELESIDQQRSAQAKELEELISENRLEFQFRQLPTGTAWLVDVHGDRALIAAANQEMKPLVFRERGINQNAAKFRQWATSLKAQDRYFVFVVRPDGIEHYDALRAEADKLNASIGLELLGANAVFIDPNSGAMMK